MQNLGSKLPIFEKLSWAKKTKILSKRNLICGIKKMQLSVGTQNSVGNLQPVIRKLQPPVSIL